MHDQPGRFVDNQHCGVLVYDIKGDIFGPKRLLVGAGLAPQQHAFSTDHLTTRLTASTGYLDMAFLYPLLQAAAREIREHYGQRLIDTFAGQRFRNVSTAFFGRTAFCPIISYLFDGTHFGIARFRAVCLERGGTFRRQPDAVSPDADSGSLSIMRTCLPGWMVSSLVLLLLLTGGCSKGEVDITRDWSAERIYYAARDELADKRYEKAIDFYQKLDARYPYGPLAQQGKIEIAYAHWKNDDAASALAACDRFLREHPNHINVDYVYYLKGRVNFNEDLGIAGYIYKRDPTERDPVAAKEAFDAFKSLVTRFPDSKYASDARERMTYLVNTLAYHETNVAEYYFRRGAYVASVNRAQEILTSYPQTPAIERALAIMAASYHQMGLEELRDDTARTLKTNFPESNISLDFEEPSWWKLW